MTAPLSIQGLLARVQAVHRSVGFSARSARAPCRFCLIAKLLRMGEKVGYERNRLTNILVLGAAGAHGRLERVVTLRDPRDSNRARQLIATGGHGPEAAADAGGHCGNSSQVSRRGGAAGAARPQAAEGVAQEVSTPQPNNLHACSGDAHAPSADLVFGRDNHCPDRRRYGERIYLRSSSASDWTSSRRCFTTSPMLTIP